MSFVSEASRDYRRAENYLQNRTMGGFFRPYYSIDALKNTFYTPVQFFLNAVFDTLKLMSQIGEVLKTAFTEGEVSKHLAMSVAYRAGSILLNLVNAVVASILAVTRLAATLVNGGYQSTFGLMGDTVTDFFDRYTPTF